jgi:hypothetical protein
MAQNKAFGQLLVEITGSAAKLQKATTEATGYVKNMSKEISELKETIEGTFAFKATEGAIEKIKSLSEAFGEMAVQGAKVNDIKEAFDKLGGSAETLKVAQDAVQGTIDKFELMKLENQGLISQGPKFDKFFGDITSYAYKWAKASGTDAKQAVEQLTTALVSGRERALIPFGIHLDQGLSKSEKFADGMEKLRQQLDDFATPAVNAGIAFEQLQTQITQAFKSFDSGVDKSTELRDAFQGLAKEINKIDWQKWGHDAADAVGGLLKIIQAGMPWAQRFVDNFLRGANYLLDSGKQGQLDRLSTDIVNAQAQLESTQRLVDAITPREGTEPSNEFIYRKQQLKEQKALVAGLREEFVKSEKEMHDSTVPVTEITVTATRHLGEYGAQVDKNAQKIANLDAELAKWRASNNSSNIKEEFANSSVL